MSACTYPKHSHNTLNCLTVLLHDNISNICYTDNRWTCTENTKLETANNLASIIDTIKTTDSASLYNSAIKAGGEKRTSESNFLKRQQVEDVLVEGDLGQISFLLRFKRAYDLQPALLGVRTVALVCTLLVEWPLPRAAQNLVLARHLPANQRYVTCNYCLRAANA